MGCQGIHKASLDYPWEGDSVCVWASPNGCVVHAFRLLMQGKCVLVAWPFLKRAPKLGGARYPRVAPLVARLQSRATDGLSKTVARRPWGRFGVQHLGHAPIAWVSGGCGPTAFRTRTTYGAFPLALKKPSAMVLHVK